MMMLVWREPPAQKLPLGLSAGQVIEPSLPLGWVRWVFALKLKVRRDLHRVLGGGEGSRGCDEENGLHHDGFLVFWFSCLVWMCGSVCTKWLSLT